MKTNCKAFSGTSHTAPSLPTPTPRRVHIRVAAPVTNEETRNVTEGLYLGSFFLFSLELHDSQYWPLSSEHQPLLPHHKSGTLKATINISYFPHSPHPIFFPLQKLYEWLSQLAT